MSFSSLLYKTPDGTHPIVMGETHGPLPCEHEGCKQLAWVILVTDEEYDQDYETARASMRSLATVAIENRTGKVLCGEHLKQQGLPSSGVSPVKGAAVALLLVWCGFAYGPGGGSPEPESPLSSPPSSSVGFSSLSSSSSLSSPLRSRNHGIGYMGLGGLVQDVRCQEYTDSLGFLKERIADMPSITLTQRVHKQAAAITALAFISRRGGACNDTKKAYEVLQWSQHIRLKMTTESLWPDLSTENDFHAGFTLAARIYITQSDRYRSHNHADQARMSIDLAMRLIMQDKPKEARQYFERALVEYDYADTLYMASDATDMLRRHQWLGYRGEALEGLGRYCEARQTYLSERAAAEALRATEEAWVFAEKMTYRLKRLALDHNATARTCRGGKPTEENDDGHTGIDGLGFLIGLMAFVGAIYLTIALRLGLRSKPVAQPARPDDDDLTNF